MASARRKHLESFASRYQPIGGAIGLHIGRYEGAGRKPPKRPARRHLVPRKPIVGRGIGDYVQDLNNGGRY